MSDIIDRAKEMPSSLNDACRTIETMAGEIERLRAQLVAAEDARLNDINAMGMMEVRACAAEAQLASASERVAEMQAEAGMYHSLYDVATERLASARMALEEIYTEDTRVTDGGKCHDLGACAEIATSALSALTDEKGT